MRTANWFRNLIQKIEQSRGSMLASILCDTAGIKLIVKDGERAERTQQLAWDQVTGVFAYKRDCFTVDQIRLLIGNEELEEWIEVTEDDEGYQHLIDQLPLRLAGFPTAEEWLQRVAIPPFETQWTQLYPRMISEA